jgi:hypothetical protein
MPVDAIPFLGTRVSFGNLNILYAVDELACAGPLSDGPRSAASRRQKEAGWFLPRAAQSASNGSTVRVQLSIDLTLGQCTIKRRRFAGSPS